MRLALVCLSFCVFAAPLFAQRQAPPVVSGKVTDITDQGRLKVLHATDDEGKEYQFTLTPRARFEVHATGDEGFVRPGQYISATGTLTNNQIFVSSVDVYLLPKGKRPPAGQVAKAARQSGQSVNTYDVSGVILARQQSPDYPEYQMLALKVGGKPPVIMLNKDFKVNVIQFDPSAAQKEAPLEMSFVPLPKDRYNLLGAKVTLEEPLKSEEVLGPLPAEKE